MSKQQLQEQLKKEQETIKILADNPDTFYFLQYLAVKHPKLSDAQLKLAALKRDYSDEYFFKISYLNKVHGVDGTTAGKIITAPVVTDQGINHEIFNTFMHYVAVNAIPANIVEKYVSECVAAGKSLNNLDHKGQTPLDYALLHNRIDCVAELSKGGVDLNALDINGCSPLHKLVQQVKDGKSSPEVIKTWGDFGLPTDTVSAHGWTPLEFAVGLGVDDAVLAFVEAGVGSKNLDNNTTVLHYCVEHDKADIITKLIGKCDFNMKDAAHAPAIAQALVHAKESVTHALVAGGTDLKVADENSGKTILHLLVEAGMLAQAALAVQVGYDPNIKDSAGSSPKDLLESAIATGACSDAILGSAVISIFNNREKAIIEEAEFIDKIQNIGASILEKLTITEDSREADNVDITGADSENTDAV